MYNLASPRRASESLRGWDGCFPAKEGTMKSEAEQLRQELERISQEPSDRGARRSPSEEAALVQRVVKYVGVQRLAGKTLLQCAKELGIKKGRLHYWVYERSRQKTAAAPPPALRPVQVDAAPPQKEPQRPRRFVVHSHFGWEVRDLELWELLVLLRGRS
jgi:hypothetical protein